VFDEKARFEFITGFRKRKLQRQKEAKVLQEEKKREERRQERAEKRKEFKDKLDAIQDPEDILLEPASTSEGVKIASNASGTKASYEDAFTKSTFGSGRVVVELEGDDDDAAASDDVAVSDARDEEISTSGEDEDEDEEEGEDDDEDPAVEEAPKRVKHSLQRHRR
jgi:ribosomal RNA-processing protein 17